jgi:pyrophosphate--fructose-6-phosphate 1-phosphotransferase
MNHSSNLQKARQAHVPEQPSILQDVGKVAFNQGVLSKDYNEQIKAHFPLTSGQSLLLGETSHSSSSHRALNIGVVFSGGPAAGGHNAIIGIFETLKKLNPNSRLFGFLNGPEGILSEKYKELTKEFLVPYFNQGGFDMIGSGRVKIENEEQLFAALAVAKKMQLDGLVIIGGDDSNTNAAVLAEYFLKNNCHTKVIGVPKTIDGDLKNAQVAISFGFDTACKTYSEIIGNIARDCLSAKKYYHFIRLMGRSASHIALECALQTQVNLAYIGEEVAANGKTLVQLTNEIADLVCLRASHGKNYGVILIPEGLIEFIPEIGILIKELNQHLTNQVSFSAAQISSKLTPSSQKCFTSLPMRIQEQLLLNRDPHGNVQVSLIETERLIIETVSQELEKRRAKSAFNAKFNTMHHFLGYEGRSGFPSNFDCNYCYVLGATAALLVNQGFTSYMAFVSNLNQSPKDWGIGGVPLTSLMHLEMRKGKEKPVIQKTLVDLKGKAFIHFQQQREDWKISDAYLFPGPIQFFGHAELTEQVPFTLTLESKF